MNQSKFLRLIGVILLLIAIPELPYGYYTFLRIAITILSVYMIFVAMGSNKVGWGWIFGGIAILFNPLFPVYLTKEIWVVIDIVVGLIFIISIFAIKLPLKD